MNITVERPCPTTAPNPTLTTTTAHGMVATVTGLQAAAARRLVERYAHSYQHPAHGPVYTVAELARLCRRYLDGGLV